MRQRIADSLANSPLGRALARRQMQRFGTSAWSAHIVDEFIHGDGGAAYGLGPREKTNLVETFRRITGAVESGTAPIVHTVLARAILAIPPDTPGDLVECGVWHGASACSLSHLARLTGRRLKVCDSFQGLPDDGERLHTGLHTGVYGHYTQGMFKGTLDEVRTNITAHGCIEVCDFVEGWFGDSLGTLHDPVAFAFLDVDLESSTRDCLRALWPRLNDGGYVYADDAGDLDVVKVYFDEPWWQAELGCAAPGFVGSGCGLPLSPSYSAIGYARKVEHFKPEDWKRVPFLHYPEAP